MEVESRTARTHARGTEGLHPDRAADRGRDHRHPGRDRDPEVRQHQGEGGRRAMRSDLRNLAAAQETYWSENRMYYGGGIPTPAFTLQPTPGVIHHDGERATRGLVRHAAAPRYRADLRDLLRQRALRSRRPRWTARSRAPERADRRASRCSAAAVAADRAPGQPGLRHLGRGDPGRAQRRSCCWAATWTTLAAAGGPLARQHGGLRAVRRVPGAPGGARPARAALGRGRPLRRARSRRSRRPTRPASWAPVRPLPRHGRELLDAQSQMVRVEKLAGIGRLAAGVAHEIRNPLGAWAPTSRCCGAGAAIRR